MTQAVMIIIVILAILLSLHIFIIVWLLWQQRNGNKSEVQDDHTYLVVYASQSGHAESWAKHTTEQLQLIHQQVTLKNIQKLTATDLIQYQRILWLVITYGEGDAPDDAQHFVHKILSQPVDLSHLSFAILALGDKRYTNFCQFGQSIEQWLLQQKAQPLFSTVLVDQLNSRDLEQWLTALEQLTAMRLTALDNERETIELKFAHRQCLNVGSAGEPIYKIQLVAEQELVWSSGDILEIQCENNIIEIQQFLVAHQQDDFNDIDALKTLNLRQLPNREHHSFAAWLEHFDRLPKREYSIASLPENGLIELVVRQQQTETGLGLGSGWLTAGLQHNQPLQAYIRNNPGFHLQHHPQPLILIGNGTGIAGLVAHLKQREQWGYGQNWLIFGERQQQFDYLYHAEIQYWQQHGFLQHVDYAFSRDQAEKIYVQDILKQQSTRLKQWIEQGAAVYVCGSLNGMAVGVDQVLKEILGDELVEQLKHELRYQRDVY